MFRVHLALRRAPRCSLGPIPHRKLHLSQPFHAGLIELIKANREIDVEAALPSAQNADVTDIDQFGSTPLILAAQRDWAFVVSELLRQPGVDPNHQNLFGSTALICAAANGYISTLEELLSDRRVELEVGTRMGQTALFKAVLFGHMNTTERLLQAGAQAKVTNKMGQTLLDVVTLLDLAVVACNRFSAAAVSCGTASKNIH